MAFAASRVLRIVTKYSQEMRNPYQIDGKKMVYNPDRYGYQYSSNLIKEGYETGARFLNRTPKYKEMHPEVLDNILYQRYVFFYIILAILYIRSEAGEDWQNENREFEYQRDKDRGFVDRYTYKQMEVEYLSNTGRNLAL